MTDTEFDLCVDKYIKMVYRIAFHYFGRQEDVEDIAQDCEVEIGQIIEDGITGHV